ncbi:unnamed protein product [Protopolystoma xenopodis]|uniref:Uncharacterized protein n=1 Tax=Protopolystoma xenopodis TaxID=117903 RepID=A0A448X6M2_9PLAT|nr:unnamed protein product [Protopolystoma xenopodis]
MVIFAPSPVRFPLYIPLASEWVLGRSQPQTTFLYINDVASSSEVSPPGQSAYAASECHHFCADEIFARAKIAPVTTSHIHNRPRSFGNDTINKPIDCAGVHTEMSNTDYSQPIE